MVLLVPSFLVLLPLTLVVLRREGRWDLRGPGGVRAVAVVALVLALARPVVPGADEREHHVVVLDHRGAAAQPSIAGAATRLAALPRDARVVLVEIGGPLAEESLEGRAVERIPAANLADALGAAAAAVPASARGAVTLVTDGRDESVAELGAVEDLKGRGIPLHAFAVDRDAAVLRPVALDAPEGLRAGATGIVRVVLEGVGPEARVTLTADEEEWGSESVAAVDGRSEVRFAVEPPAAGFVRASVRVEVPGEAEPLERTATLAVQDPTRILALTSRTVGSGQRLGELAGPGFQVEERAPDGGELPDPGDYDLVVVDDRPASTLPASFQARLVASVQGGGVGLLASGGEAAFGPGGWHDTPLASILPVDAVQKEEKRDPSVALVIIIDTSGSMGGNRVQLAKEVSRLSLKRLLPHDKAGIVEFYGAKRWAAPLQPASNHIELERALNRMQAGGGTVILPAIEEAWYGLKNVNVRYKHVLVLTDGGVESGAFEPLLRAMADDGITVSTVLIGGDAHSEFLVNLANWGKGRFYGVPNRFNLPEILLKQPASAKLPAWRPVPTEVEAGGGPTWWGDVDPSAVPRLAGHVETRLRPGAEEILSTAGGTRPVLASWRHGLGRVTAFTSELAGPGAGEWSDWDQRGAFVARVLRRTAKDLGGAFRFTARREGARLVVEAARREEGSALPAAVLGAEERLTFHERAPGWFVAERWLRGAEFEQDTQLLGGTSEALLDPVRLVVGAPRPHAVADGSRGVDARALARWAGGSVLEPASSSGLAVGGPERAPGTDELRPVLALLALALHLLSIYLRRRPLGSSTGVAA